PERSMKPAKTPQATSTMITAALRMLFRMYVRKAIFCFLSLSVFTYISLISSRGWEYFICAAAGFSETEMVGDGSSTGEGVGEGVCLGSAGFELGRFT